jgi:hypothetical protein
MISKNVWHFGGRRSQILSHGAHGLEHLMRHATDIRDELTCAALSVMAPFLNTLRSLGSNLRHAMSTFNVQQTPASSGQCHRQMNNPQKWQMKFPQF